MQAYPWYTTVRVILDDPAYADWFTSFVPGGSYPNGTWYVGGRICGKRLLYPRRTAYPYNLTLLAPPLFFYRYSDPCDANNRTLCSTRYHNQEQSPAYPHGDGDCNAPTCDCGKVSARHWRASAPCTP